MTVKAAPMTPENYHLTHGPKLRDQLGVTIKNQSAKVEAEYDRIKQSEMKRLGLKATGKKHWNDDIVIAGRLRLRISMDNGSEIRDEIKKQLGIDPGALSLRKKELCKTLDPAGAKRFGSFTRTKYGRTPTKQQIVQAHEEWLDLLSNCEC